MYTPYEVRPVGVCVCGGGGGGEIAIKKRKIDYIKIKIVLFIISFGKITESLNVFFSETAWPIFTRFHMRASVERMLTICSNGSAPLNKMGAMPIYGKNT